MRALNPRTLLLPHYVSVEHSVTWHPCFISHLSHWGKKVSRCEPIKQMCFIKIKVKNIFTLLKFEFSEQQVTHQSLMVFCVNTIQLPHSLLSSFFLLPQVYLFFCIFTLPQACRDKIQYTCNLKLFIWYISFRNFILYLNQHHYILKS